ncbi:hypothetical protein ACWDAZ_38005 [Streptomyces sp. NPDC001215]
MDQQQTETDDNDDMEILVKVLGPIEVTDAEGHPVLVGSRRYGVCTVSGVTPELEATVDD